MAEDRFPQAVVRSTATGPASLTVGCPSGLANRLRVLASGLAWQRLTGRRFTLLWPRNAPCSAAFTDLFEPMACVEEHPEHAVLQLPAVGSYLFAPMGDLGRSTAPHLAFRCSGWLVPPRLSPFASLVARLLPQAPATFTQQHARVLELAARELESLRPRQVVMERVEQCVARHFRPTMIGVHLRRGDLLVQRPDVWAEPERMIATVWEQLRRHPQAGVFLATDDGAPDPYNGTESCPEGLVARFGQEFGPRFVTTSPGSLDRRRPEAIQDALVDLLLLRRTDLVVGTEASSFSELAAFGRGVPLVTCRGRDPGPWCRRFTLMQPLLLAAGVLRYGRLVPFPVLRAHLRVRWQKSWREALRNPAVWAIWVRASRHARRKASGCRRRQG